MEWLERFVLGGLIVSAFAVIGDVLRPKGFAGLFAAAPSVALATLALTALSNGKQYAAMEARSMIAGAFAFLVYALVSVHVLVRKQHRACTTTLAALGVWGMCSLVLWALFLK